MGGLEAREGLQLRATKESAMVRKDVLLAPLGSRVRSLDVDNNVAGTFVLIASSPVMLLIGPWTGFERTFWHGWQAYNQRSMSADMFFQ